MSRFADGMNCARFLPSHHHLVHSKLNPGIHNTNEVPPLLPHSRTVAAEERLQLRTPR